LQHGTICCNILFDRSGRTVILPLDIIVPVGPFEGAGDTSALLDMASTAGVNALILRWGEAKRHADRIDPSVGLIVRVSGSTGLHEGNRRQALLTSVEACATIGGDAVCIDVELGGDDEIDSLQSLARVCEEAERLGLVVLAEVAVAETPSSDGNAPVARAVAWAVRTAQEAGADFVKVAYPGSASAVAVVCELADIPVVVAGGAPRRPADALRIADDALRGGAAGTAFGRNVIGHESPLDMQEALVDLVRGQATLAEVCGRLEVPGIAPTVS
jgi:DhnA family fructose-bisphosphate aldolase class Ia